MESKCLKFLLNESEINKIAKEVGLCTRIRKFTPMGVAVCFWGKRVKNLFYPMISRYNINFKDLDKYLNKL
ncbi:MAG: hypothetical protein ACRC5T_06600, partial [Cetobacterium sp.]